MGNQPNEGGAQKEPAVGLKRTLGLREAITITAGTVIGVGLFTTGGNVVGEMGPFVVLATALAALISIYPALMYGEMGAALPFAGGTYQYASLGLGRPAGFLAGWNFIMSLIAVTGGEALAFSYYFKTIFLAFGVELPVDDAVIAIIALVAFVIANVRGVELTGKLQNGFMFFFWGVAAIWFLTMIPNVQLPNFVTAPDFMGDLGGGGFIAAVAMIWWCFAGFETCCAMGEEIRHPQINIPRAMMLSPFIIFVVNALFQWFLVGIVPADGLAAVAESSAPYAEAMMSAGILGLPLDQGSHRAGDDGNDQHADDRHGIAGHGHVELRVRVHEVIVDAESAEYGSGDAPQIAVRHPGNDEHSQCVDQCRVVLNARIAQQDVTDLVCCGQNKKCFKQI